MTTTRYRFPNTGLLFEHAIPPAPEWTSTIYPNTYTLTTSTAAAGSANTNVANGNADTTTRVRTHSFVSPVAAATELVTHVRFQTEAEHWLGGLKAVALRVRVVAGDAVVRDLLPYTLTNATGPSAFGWHYYGCDVELSEPVALEAGQRLFVEYGGQCEPGSAGQGLYVAVGLTGTDQAYNPGASAPGNGAWIEFTTVSAPNPPTGLHQTGATTTTATIGYTAPAAGAAPTGYELRVDAGDPVVVGLTTTPTITGLLPSSAYTVEVRTVASTGPSSWSLPLTITTADPAPYRPWLVSETLLALAGFDPQADQPAFQWHRHDVDDWTLDEPRSLALMGWTITTGRTSPRDRVPPAVATVTIAAWDDYAAAGLPQLGERFRLALSPKLAALGIDEADLPRFTGEVTDVDLDPDTRVLAVTGVGRFARQGRLPVDGTSWPVEREGARVARIIAAAGAEPGTLDPGRVDLAAHTAIADASSLAGIVSDSTTGQLVERRDGALDWHDADHRRDVDQLLELDASELLAGFRWAQHVGDLTNAVTARYAGGEVTVEDSVSVEDRGRYPASLETLLTAPAAAQAIAGLIVGRYGRPVWLLPAVMVDLLRTLDRSELGAGVKLGHGHRVQLTGLPAGGPYTDRDAYVEGVTETLTPRAWRLTATVADAQLSGAPLRWRDVPAGVRWTDVRDGLRWLDVALIQDPADLT